MSLPPAAPGDSTTTTVTALFRDLEQGARAVTSSRRLARQVLQRYADWQIEGGAVAWPTPRVRVLDDWLLETWQWALAHRSNVPSLLSDEQELLLWEQVIRRRSADPGSRILLQLSGTARAARLTWRRLHEWKVDWQRLRDYRSADTEAFLVWARAVRQLLDERRWLTPAELPLRLAEHFSRHAPEHDEPVWWMGFDLVPPVVAQLMEVMTERGGPQHHFEAPGTGSSDPMLVECGDTEGEWHRIARWARAEIEADPRVSLGVVCPDLARHRDRIEEILEDVLHPELAWRPDTARCFHLSLGRTLAQYPVVSAALDLLRCTERRVPFDVVSRVVRSPYLGGAEEEHDARVHLETDLRRAQQETFSLSRLGVLSDRRPGLARLGGLIEAATKLELPEHAGAGDWASLFTDWLRAFGWPGDRPQNSQEFQIVAAWREQLSRFAALGAVQNRWTRADALSKLSGLAATRVLQFHDDQAPLQVMGASEAAGLWFDKLWLADMSDAVWPPPPQSDPFIPVALQKALGMPDASAQSVLERTRRCTDNLLASAAEVRVSFAARDAEAPAALSPLFDPARAAPNESRDTYGGREAQLQANAPALETVEDHRAPPLDGGIRSGGVGLVADQARCPFQALTHHRLRARELPAVAPGLSVMTRGILAHRVARDLWERLETREALLGLDRSTRHELVADCVAGVLADVFADSPFQRRFLEIEQQRLEELFLEWLALEAGRESFRVVATELKTRVVLGDAELDLRVDRIDELEDGRRLVLDYKTGQLPQVREWVDPRTEEPQLPMYALSVAEPVAALALAGVRRGECELRGIGEGVFSLTPVTELDVPDMAALESHWSTTFTGLLEEHRRGTADVDPKTPQTCRLCDAMSLCRVFERTELVDD